MINIDKDFLIETECIDYNNPIIQEKVNELKLNSNILRTHIDLFEMKYHIRGMLSQKWYLVRRARY